MDIAVRIYVDCSGHDDLNRMPAQVMGALMRWGCTLMVLMVKYNALP
ncbi:hypothetical protein MRM75_03935 [bacterium 19CA06SA08-2]|uniref:Uncharacterized protein n=1 Tax=bacterium 19CA06SA08-2 TaxID=2920658 RepID=A0AAU6U7Q6_UNCXX